MNRMVSIVVLVASLFLYLGCRSDRLRELPRTARDMWKQCFDAMVNANCRKHSLEQGPRVASRVVLVDPLAWCIERHFPLEDYASLLTAGERRQWLLAHGCPKSAIGG